MQKKKIYHAKLGIAHLQNQPFQLNLTSCESVKPLLRSFSDKKKAKLINILIMYERTWYKDEKNYNWGK